MIKLSDVKKWAERKNNSYIANDKEFDLLFKKNLEEYILYDMSGIIFGSGQNGLDYRRRSKEDYPLLEHALIVIETLGYVIDYEN